MPRVLRSPLGDWVDPAVAFAALCGDDTDVVWLDSGPGAIVGRSYIGRAARVITSQTVPGAAEGASVLEFLREELSAGRVESAGEGFELGWVGWLGYENRFETMRIARDRVSPYPDAAFLYLDQAVEFDHATRTVTLLSLDEPGAFGRSLGSTDGPDGNVATLREPRGAREPRAAASPRVPRLAHWRDSDPDYLAMIRECKARIAAGDAYQLCLTTEVSLDVHPDPVDTYLALRQINPSHHGALLRVGDISLLSASPEQFLTVSPSGAVESRPIKGTRPRGATPELDRELAAALESSEKERAENLMIVDLMRNDIGRVSRVGSVEVPSLLGVESYATVHQLVSTVRGQLDEGLDGIDAVVACFPAGSMTGTPKSSATRILDGLEDHPRGIYSGAFGYFGLDGRIDLAMVIRSIVLSPEGASIGTGGGITALSDPDEELAEVKIKAAPLLTVLGAV
jgi:anthranilate synthase component 1